MNYSIIHYFDDGIEPRNLKPGPKPNPKKRKKYMRLTRDDVKSPTPELDSDILAL